MLQKRFLLILYLIVLLLGLTSPVLADSAATYDLTGGRSTPAGRLAWPPGNTPSQARPASRMPGRSHLATTTWPAASGRFCSRS